MNFKNFTAFFKNESFEKLDFECERDLLNKNFDVKNLFDMIWASKVI